MERKDYRRTITVQATPAKAFRKISEINGWWAKNLKGKAERQGDKFTVDFGRTFVDFKIAELVPNKKIVWKVTDCNLEWIEDKKEWSGTEVVFEITEHKNLTQIDFTHNGLVPGIECYDACEKGWDDHVTKSLVSYINEGIGEPV